MKSSASHQRVPGASLRRIRNRAGFKQVEIARHLGVLPQWVSAIEATAAVTPRTAGRYLAAVSELVRARNGA